MQCDSISSQHNAIRCNEKNMIAFISDRQQIINELVSSDFKRLETRFIKQVYQIGQAYFS